jgi:hypothetical protein
MAANGTTISGISAHFMQRVFGTMVDPQKLSEDLQIIRRSGVEIDSIFNALFSPESIGNIVARKDGARSIKLRSTDCLVTINPDTGILIQVNPL